MTDLSSKLILAICSYIVLYTNMSCTRCTGLVLLNTFMLGGGGSDGLTPVNPARFQVLDVDERCDIRTFVQKNSLIFKTGQGFYEFTKPEKISDKKEVVLVDKVRNNSHK